MGKDYSLKSGERQFADTLDGIRGDHLQRYEFGIKHLPQTPGFGLDVFCGNGYGTRMICAAGHGVMAIDGSADAIAVANQNYADNGSYFIEKLWPFTLPENRFEFVFCLESIEHVEDSDRFLSQIMRALKPGGILVLSTPNEDLMPFVPAQHKFHFRHFTQDQTFAMVKHMELLQWGGQIVYDISEGGRHELLDAQAPVIPETPGQFTVLAARKNKLAPPFAWHRTLG